MKARANRKPGGCAFPPGTAPTAGCRTPGPGERIKRGHDAGGWQYGRAVREGDPRRLVEGSRTFEIVEVITSSAGVVVGYGIAGAELRSGLRWLHDRALGGLFWSVLP